MSEACQGIGLILHGRRYRENSRIINIFTRDSGRITVLARFPRNKAARHLAQLQPFHESLFHWRGRGELQNLQSADPVEAFVLPDKAGICGLYCNELLLYLTPGFEPIPELYDAYRQTLTALSNPARLAPHLRQFELVLLEKLGYGLGLESDCQTHEPLDARRRYYFHPRHGFSRHHLETGEIEVNGAAIHDLAVGDFFNSRSEKETRRILGLAIQSLLGGRALQSKQLIRSVMKYQK